MHKIIPAEMYKLSSLKQYKSNNRWYTTSIKLVADLHFLARKVKFSNFRFWTATNHWSIFLPTQKFTEIGCSNNLLGLIGTGGLNWTKDVEKEEAELRVVVL